jgi:hypothetical protein
MFKYSEINVSGNILRNTVAWVFNGTILREFVRTVPLGTSDQRGPQVKISCNDLNFAHTPRNHLRYSHLSILSITQLEPPETLGMQKLSLPATVFVSVDSECKT